MCETKAFRKHTKLSQQSHHSKITGAGNIITDYAVHI